MEQSLTIGEFAKRCGLSRSALRFFAQSMSLIRAAERLVVSEEQVSGDGDRVGSAGCGQRRLGHTSTPLLITRPVVGSISTTVSRRPLANRSHAFPTLASSRVAVLDGALKF